MGPRSITSEHINDTRCSAIENLSQKSRRQYPKSKTVIMKKETGISTFTGSPSYQSLCNSRFSIPEKRQIRPKSRGNEQNGNIVTPNASKVQHLLKHAFSTPPSKLKEMQDLKQTSQMNQSIFGRLGEINAVSLLPNSLQSLWVKK